MGKKELLELGEKAMAACKESGKHRAPSLVAPRRQHYYSCTLATAWRADYLRHNAAGDAGVTKLRELKTALAL